MSLARRVEPEWLDALAADDKRAVRSRSDLRRINALMTNAGIVARELRAAHPTPRTIADIGAGDGTFMLTLAQKTRWTDVELVLVDRHDVISGETQLGFQALGWRVQCVVADVFEWLARPGAPFFDAIVANLFLHHFAAERLRPLLALAAARSQMVVACEPRRSRLAVSASHLLGFIGCNDVSRHDALASVHAGFRASELSDLWPGGGWSTRESARGVFSHCFVASRDAKY